jgi:hypothetical protein
MRLLRQAKSGETWAEYRHEKGIAKVMIVRHERRSDIPKDRDRIEKDRVSDCWKVLLSRNVAKVRVRIPIVKCESAVRDQVRVVKSVERIRMLGKDSVL